MSEDSEKRFHSIMDRLFHSPKTKPVLISSSGIQSSRGKKRGNSVMNASMAESSNSEGNVVVMGGFKRFGLSSSSTDAPLCRPWDRADLMRRLATFKSMTWFGKPKVVSAVNCARRGWISVEMDIIACEACGARLLFSTPSSWSQQQIEKAAAVFSLKLDSGHKQHCPWINNACDETLAHFPPTPAPALVDGYRERFSLLLQLSALPVISSSAIDYMRSPQLEHFLEQSSMLELGCSSADTSRTEYLGNEHEAVSAKMYYQAQKLISLCGWEPRLLPYVVDCEDQSTQSAKSAHPSESPAQIVNGQNPGIVMRSSSGANEVIDETTELDKDHPFLGGQQSDPASVVLDCKLCGANVGLWAFTTVPRPLELFRLVESSEMNGQNDSTVSCITGATGTDDLGQKNQVDHNGAVMSTAASLKERSLNLNLSIAGGPSPAKQNYRATVCLPIISRHLRAGLSSNSDVGDRIVSNISSMNEENALSDLQNTNSFQQEKEHTINSLCVQIVQPEDMDALKDKTKEDGDDQSSCLNKKFNEENTPRNASNDDMSSEGRYSNKQGLPDVHALGTCSDSRVENPIESMQDMPQGSGRNDTTPEDVENAGNAEGEVDIGSQVKECITTGPDDNVTDENGETSKSNSLMMVTAEVCNHRQDENFSGADMIHHKVTEACHNESSYVASCLEATLDNACKIDWRKGDKGSDFQKSSDVQVTEQKVEEVKNTVQSSINNEIVSAHGLEKDKRAQLDQAMEFDPIRQHRHFCPWIASTGSAAPGWQLTLSALDRGKESSHLLLTESPSSPTFEMDDPIASVRKLFMSPSAKRMKVTHGSS